MLSLIWIQMIYLLTKSQHNNWYNCKQDENACLSIECTAEDAAIRSKIICNEFPFYAGSVNLFDYQSQWSFISETQTECTNTYNSTTPYCNSWTNFDSDKTSECKCTKYELTNNEYNTYCISWQCHNVENKILSSECECIPNNNNGIISLHTL
eukprot:185947_1